MKELEGLITISRPMNSGKEIVTIRIEDEASSIRAIEIEMDLKNFASALFACGNMPCRFKINTHPNVGKVREYKEEIALIPVGRGRRNSERDTLIKEALAPFEVDGWQGRKNDADNNHNWTGPSQIIDGKNCHPTKILFERWVDPEPKSDSPL